MTNLNIIKVIIINVLVTMYWYYFIKFTIESSVIIGIITAFTIIIILVIENQKGDHR